MKEDEKEVRMSLEEFRLFSGMVEEALLILEGRRKRKGDDENV